MVIPERVETYLARQPQTKQTDLNRLHGLMVGEFPECRLWFNDGTNERGQVGAKAKVGYGLYTIAYADVSSREFYSIDLSANTTGISVYGLEDKTTWRTDGPSIGRARITASRHKFRRLSDINPDALQAATQDGMTLDQSARART